MHNTCPRSSPAPADDELQTNESPIDGNAVIEDSAMSIEIDLDKTKPSTLEQTTGNGIEPNNANENPAMSIEGNLAKMSDTLAQILDVLKESTIAEERGKDDNSKFWATYKKVSTEHDDDFLNRANDDMGIILTFAGLFSAVNSTFIVGMQPDPGDTTNALVLQLIQIIANGSNSVPHIDTLSSSTGFSSSTVWTQTLAYASLAFSVLAAFGAVLGKQWLNSYKSVQGRGSLEERGIERQMKLDGLESFRLQTILRVFLVLLQISLLLFGLSLSANMWAQQTTISSVIICTTAFGILFYVGTFLVSVLRPNSPFRTPASELLATICQKFYPGRSTSIRHTLAKSSAIRWILETSTNPEIVEAAATIVPCVQWPPSLDASAAFKRLRDNFVACRNRPELYVKYGKAMAHLCIQPVKIDKELLGFLWDENFNSTRSRFIHDAFMAGCAAHKQFKSSREDNARRRKHQANARTALRTMLVHGTRNKLSRPDDEHLIWYGDLRWRHSDEREPSCEKFDWLVDYLEGDTNTDDETEGDAFLALSAMRRLGSPAKRPSYINSLIRCMHSKSPRVRHTALRAVFEAREELASMTSASMPQNADPPLLDGLSSALLSAVRPNDYQTIHGTRPDGSFHKDRDFCYIRLIYALTEKDEWCQRLIRDGHLEWCISLVDGICREDYLRVGSCLLVIFERVKSLGTDLPFSPAEERQQLPIANAWDTAQYASRDDPYVDGIQALVTVTRLQLSALDDGVLADLAAKVHRALVNLQQKQKFHVNAGIAQAEIDAAISSMKDLHTDLGHMVEEWNTSQRDDEAFES